MDKYMKANQLNWDERVPIHLASKSYDVDSFIAGRCSLRSIEVDELGDVSGKKLLHLQCHFGMDTLSWARRGAIVTGVDFSSPAIEKAKMLAETLNIKAKFILSDIFELPQNLDEYFDIVFTSYGALCWISDLEKWANVIAHFLKPNGTFYVIDGHPIANMIVTDENEQLRISYSYFNIGPVKFDFPYTYTDGEICLSNSVTYEWFHSIGEIITSLIKAGLEIQFLHEFPFSFHKYLPNMVKDKYGWWRLPNGDERVPFMFSIKARKKI